MQKRVRVHIYTVDDTDGYICLDTGSVPMYVSFRRTHTPADWMSTYGLDFKHLTSIVPTLQGGNGSNKYTSYLTGYITIDSADITRDRLRGNSSSTVVSKASEYLASKLGWNFPQTFSL